MTADSAERLNSLRTSIADPSPDFAQRNQAEASISNGRVRTCAGLRSRREIEPAYGRRDEVREIASSTSTATARPSWMPCGMSDILGERSTHPDDQALTTPAVARGEDTLDVRPAGSAWP